MYSKGRQGLEPACEVVGCNDVNGMKIITRVWTWIRIQIRDLRPQLRLCLRVTVAALLSFVLGKSLNFPLGGLWAVLTAVVVTQTSVGGSLKATIEYLTGTLGGAVYAGVIAVLILPANEISHLIALAIAVAPLALLAAINTNFRVAPYTAVIVILGSSITHAGPLDLAFYRVLEVAIGGVIGLAVSLLVFPARAHVLAIEAAACLLDLMAGILPEVLIGLMQTLDEKSILRKQDRLGQAFTRLATIAAEAMRERMAYLGSAPDPGPVLHTLLGLHHDIIIMGEAAVVPLSEPLQTRLGPPLARAFETAADYLRGSSAALTARRNPPPLNAVDASFESYAVEIAGLRREGLTPDLPGDEVERLFALGFTLEQLRRNFENLEQCVTDNARSTIGGDRRRGN